MGDREKEKWLVVTEYHLVVTPDAFQSSLEVDFCCETESDWSYGPEDKVRESYVLHIECNCGVRSSTIRSKSGRDKFVSLIHEPLEEERTNAYWEMQGGILWGHCSKVWRMILWTWLAFRVEVVPLICIMFLGWFLINRLITNSETNALRIKWWFWKKMQNTFKAW